MLKVIRTMFILLLMVLIISGCTNTQEHLNDTATKTSEIHEENNESTKASVDFIDEENAKALFKEYTEIFYTIKDFTSLNYKVVDGIKKMETVDRHYESIKPFMTEEGYKRIVGNRFLNMLSAFAKNRQANITVDSVDFRLESKSEDNIFYWYEVNLLLKHLDNTQKHMTIEGQVNITKVDEALKIKRDGITTSISFFDSYDNVYTTDVLHSVVHTSEDGIYKQIKSYIPRMYFAVTNKTNKKMELDFSTQQQFNVKLYQKSKEVFNYETSRSFGDEPTAITLDPGKHLVCYLPYPKDIKPGIYEYRFEILDDHFNTIEPLTGTIMIMEDTTD